MTILNSKARWAFALIVLIPGIAFGAPATPPDGETDAPASSSRPETADGAGSLLRGTGIVVGKPAPVRSKEVHGARDVTLNFAAISVQEAAKAILGDLLGLNYTVDPSVQGTITVQTTGPVHQSEILPIFETALEAAKLVLVQKGNLYTIKPLTAGQRLGTMLSPANLGYGTEAVSLKYVNASALKKILDPLVPDGGIAQSDQTRNVLFITGSVDQRQSMRELIAQFDVNWLKGMSFAMFVPQWSNSQDLATQLDKVLNSEGSPTAGTIRFVPIEQMNAVIAIARRADYLEDVRKLVDKLDRVGEKSQRRLFVYKVQNGRATDLSEVLAASFGSGTAASTSNNSGATGLGTAGSTGAVRNTASRSTASSAASGTNTATPGAPAGVTPQTVNLGDGQQAMTITADDEKNALIIYGTPQQYKIVEDALRKLDIMPLQVMISATIGEVTLTKDLQLGVQWYMRSGENSYDLSQGKTGLPVQSFPGFSYLLSHGQNIQVILNALRSVTKVNVLSAPQVFVLNNHTATLQVGDQVPVTTASAISVETSTSPIVNSVEYRDTGVILKVTPRVNDGGMVLLDIAQEVSDVSTTSSSKIDSPTIQERRIATSVAVRDGQTIVMGGLIKDSRDHNKTGVPYLRDIPVLGELFGSREDQQNRTELIVLLTPTVVRSDPDMQSLREELERKLPAAASLAKNGLQ